jgi:hypothetical protein
MKSSVLAITLIIVAVAGGVARATEMVEVPSAPPYMPPRLTTPLEKKERAADNLRFIGLAALGLGTLLEGTALVMFINSPCTHDCFLDPVQPEARAPIGAFVGAGIAGVAVGLPLAIAGGSRLRQLRKAELKLHAGANGVALSGRF